MCKKRLLLLVPGPKYDLRDDFEDRLAELSKHFEGVVLTASPQSMIVRFGDFWLVAVSLSGTKGLLFKVRYFIKGIYLAVNLRLKGKKPDLVVTYDPLRTGLLGIVLALITNSRFVTEVNGDYTAWANYADVRNHTLRRLKRKLYMTVEAFVLKRADGVKLLYSRQIDYFRPMLGPKVVQTFPNYVNLTSFKNLGEEKIVLFAGFPFYVKGVDILINAFKQVAPKYPDWKLKILGWFPDLTELNAHIAGHPQIFHHKPVHHCDMPQHIGKCAIFVLASRTEAMGRVLLEAMAAGKPRIGARVGGIPTVINDGQDGFLFESENIDELAGLLDKLMANSKLRASLGQAGARRISHEFSSKQYFEKTKEFYDQALAPD
jgi:glycosyltransferase involved in cell wall biosynthesis